jgi:cyclohexa-1,5-dienecarbonyl-CoA hydratase
VIDTRRNERVEHLTINAPKVNVLDAAGLTELARHVERCAADDTLAAVILSGAERCFSAGAAVAEHRQSKARAMLDALLTACRGLADLPVPVVALVHGACMGGAMELIMFCDFVVADPGATFALPEVKLAFFPPLACSQLPRLTGRQNAAFAALTGETLGADQAVAMGLVQKLLPKDEWPTIDALFNGLSAPVLRLAKQALRLGSAPYVEGDLTRLSELFLDRLYALEDVEEGIASFEQRRPPVWQHR